LDCAASCYGADRQNPLKPKPVNEPLVLSALKTRNDKVRGRLITGHGYIINQRQAGQGFDIDIMGMGRQRIDKKNTKPSMSPVAIMAPIC